MTQAVIAAIPLSSRFVPSCLESIIDKRVSGVALNFLEKFIDWLCSWFYLPYNLLYNSKMARVHVFNDGMAKLVDSTNQGVAKIDRGPRNEYVSLHDRKVFFSPNPNIEMVFARQAFTDYVVVKDDERRRPGWYQIIEQETSRLRNQKPMEKIWSVNTNQLHLFEQVAKEAYLVEKPRAAI